MSCFCALLFSQLLVLISYLCADDFLPLLYVCLPLPVSFPTHNFFVSSCGLFFSTQRISFSNGYKAGLVVLNSLSFCFSVKLLISPSNLNASFAEQSILGCRFFPFITLNIWCHSWPAEFLQKSADNLMGVPLYVIHCFFPCCF